MKKALSILLCYAVIVTASFAGTLAHMDFETKSLWNKRPTFGLDDNGVEQSGIGTYWYVGGDDLDNESKIRGYTDEEDPYDEFDSSEGNPRPDYMHTFAANKGVLAVATSSPLHRTFRPIAAATGPSKDQAEPIPSGGVFIDALVQFTLANDREDPFTVMSDGAKLSCRLCRTSAEDETPLFIVTAGCIKDSDLSFTNYVTTANVIPGQWYRLTAKVVADASTCSSETLVGFNLYLDGKLVTCAEDEYAIGEDAAAIFAGNEYFERRALFPSLQRYGGSNYADRMYSVGMDGTGMVDEIAITTENPFKVATSSIDLAIVCDDTKMEKVVCIKTDAVGASVTNEFTGAISGSIVQVEPRMVVELIPTAKASYGVDPNLTISGNAVYGAVDGCTILRVDGYKITMAPVDLFTSSDRIVASFTSKNVYFGVGTQEFSTFNEAVAAATTNVDNTISLKYSIVLSRDGSDDGQAWVYPGQNVVLDLCGNTIKGDHFDEEAAIYNQGELTILDSVGGGVIEAAGTAIAVIRDNLAVENKYRPDITKLQLGDDNSMDFTIKGRVKNTVGRGSLEIYSGSYLNPSDASTIEFYLSNYLADDRLTAEAITIDSLPGFRVVNNGNARIVRFDVPHGHAEPAKVKVDNGGTVSPSTAVAPGYDFVKWTLNGEDFDFSTPIEKSIKLVAVVQLATYSIAHDGDARIPETYTVESAYTALRPATRPLFEFDGWVDSNSGLGVEAVGEGANFTGTEQLVYGNLNLVAQWKSVPLRWENTCHRLSESNGNYSAEWPFVLPVDDTGYTPGTKIKINQIDLGIVNPGEYPSTADAISVRIADSGTTVTSGVRTFELDPETKAYVVGTNKLMNGRAKVAYKFNNNLVVEVGKTNYLWLSTSDGQKSTGKCFLRLMRTRDNRYTIIGNCDPESSPIERYREYCPAYEIYGEAVLTNE